mgnify:CR=1 FL=1
MTLQDLLPLFLDKDAARLLCERWQEVEAAFLAQGKAVMRMLRAERMDAAAHCAAVK